MTHEFTVVGEFAGAQRTWLWRNVMIVRWYGRPCAESAERLCELTDEILARMASSEKVSIVHLVTTELTLPDAATRTVLLDSTHRFATRTGISGIVILGGGFWASAIRGFVTGIALLAPRSLGLRVFGAARELLPWFTAEHAKRTGVRVDGDELLRVLDEVEASSAALIAT